MFIDLWYGNKVSEVDALTISFSDLDCEYRGNMYKAGKAIGDFSTKDSTEIQKAFPHLSINWY